MERPFDASDWKPTRLWEPSDTKYDTHQIETLISQLNSDTIAIRRHPYDPHMWLRRARTLDQLRYPELVVGDAHKSLSLCNSILGSLRQHPRLRMGYRFGFGMLDLQMSDEPGQADERECLCEYIGHLHYSANVELTRNLYFAPEFDEGRFTPQPYPWMRDEHLSRSDELVDELNSELVVAGSGNGCEPACVVRQYAFGKGVGARDGKDLLGVFATRDLSVGGTILVDISKTWGCNGPGRDGKSDNLYGGLGCQEPLHPNTEQDTTDQDMRWIRDRCGVKAADTILKCRFLLCCISDDIHGHPLDHSLLARLTPTYRDKWRSFSLENDIVVPNEALQQFGIDIFRDKNYADSYVLFVIMSRIDNNSWSDPNTASVNGLFSLLNHSCEPNAKWQTQKDHVTLKITACRNISKGEQIFVEYDQFMSFSPLEVRRSRLRRWLDCPCQCTRCLREEAEVSTSSPISSNSDWDCDDQPVLPEDANKTRRCGSDSS